MGDALSCAGRCSDSWRAQRAPAVGVVRPHAKHTPHARDIPGWPSAAALKGSTAAVSSGTASSKSPTLASLSATSVSTSGEQLTCTTIALSAARGMQVRAREAHDERAQKARRASCCQGGARERHGAILRTVEGSRMPVLAHAEFARMLGRLRKGGGHALEIELVGSRWRSA